MAFGRKIMKLADLMITEELSPHQIRKLKSEYDKMIKEIEKQESKIKTQWKQYGLNDKFIRNLNAAWYEIWDEIDEIRILLDKVK